MELENMRCHVVHMVLSKVSERGQQMLDINNTYIHIYIYTYIHIHIRIHIIYISCCIYIYIYTHIRYVCVCTYVLECVFDPKFVGFITEAPSRINIQIHTKYRF